MARAVTAGGLVPSLGVGHINARNNFCLVDDLIEPFRPLIDRLVRKNADHWNGDLSPQARGTLAGVMAGTLATRDGDTDLYRVMTLCVTSLITLFEHRTGTLDLPPEISFVQMPELPGMRDNV